MNKQGVHWLFDLRVKGVELPHSLLSETLSPVSDSREFFHSLQVQSTGIQLNKWGGCSRIDSFWSAHIQPTSSLLCNLFVGVATISGGLRPFLWASTGDGLDMHCPWGVWCLNPPDTPHRKRYVGSSINFEINQGNCYPAHDSCLLKILGIR